MNPFFWLYSMCQKLSKIVINVGWATTYVLKTGGKTWTVLGVLGVLLIISIAYFMHNEKLRSWVLLFPQYPQNGGQLSKDVYGPFWLLYVGFTMRHQPPFNSPPSGSYSWLKFHGGNDETQKKGSFDKLDHQKSLPVAFF